jgi:hypothetical protein
MDDEKAAPTSSHLDNEREEQTPTTSHPEDVANPEAGTERGQSLSSSSEDDDTRRSHQKDVDEKTIHETHDDKTIRETHGEPYIDHEEIEGFAPGHELDVELGRVLQANPSSAPRPNGRINVFTDYESLYPYPGRQHGPAKAHRDPAQRPIPRRQSRESDT